jgi:hypothetical protein
VYKKNSIGQWILVDTTTASGYSISGLEVETSYVFGVRSVDFDGNTSDILSIAAKTKSRSDAFNPNGIDTQRPSRPGRPTVSKIKRRRAMVKWGRATDNYGLARYEIQIYKSGHWRLSGVEFPFHRSHRVTRLKHGKKYKVRVIAVDSSGNRSKPSLVRRFRAR